MLRSKPRVTLVLVCPRCGPFGRGYDLGESNLRAVIGAAWPVHRRTAHPDQPASFKGWINAVMLGCGAVLTTVTTSERSYDGQIRRLRDVHTDGCPDCQGGQGSLFGPPLAP